MKRRIIVGITGASGSIYAIKLVEELYKKEIDIYIVVSNDGLPVIEYETGKSIDEHVDKIKKSYNNYNIMERLDNGNLFEKIASGSFKMDDMVIVPCSMNTVANISVGISNTLLLRASQVILKEGKCLTLVPREMPYSTIMLENLTKLSKSGIAILPATPGFYGHPETIDDLVNFVVGKILDNLNIENDIFKRWN